jgi:hypothetical protein
MTPCGSFSERHLLTARIVTVSFGTMLCSSCVRGPWCPRVTLGTASLPRWYFSWSVPIHASISVAVGANCHCSHFLTIPRGARAEIRTCIITIQAVQSRKVIPQKNYGLCSALSFSLSHSIFGALSISIHLSIYLIIIIIIIGYNTLVTEVLRAVLRARLWQSKATGRVDHIH